MIKLLLVFVFIACAQTSKNNTDSNVVDINDITSSPKVDIDKTASVEYGPSIGEEIKPEKLKNESTPKAKLYSLVLQPSLYKSFGYIAVFKKIEELDKRPIVLSSMGFSAIICALYAKHLKPNLVEWKAYELYQSIKEYPPYSAKWKKIVKEFLDKEFKNQKLSQLKILLLIPKSINDNAILSPTDKVTKAIMESLNISGKNSKSYMLKTSRSYLDKFKNYGSENTIYISNLPEVIKTKKSNKLIEQIYKNFAVRQDSIITLEGSNSNLFIDSIANISDEINQVTDSSNKFINEYFKEN